MVANVQSALVHADAADRRRQRPS